MIGVIEVEDFEESLGSIRVITAMRLENEETAMACPVYAKQSRSTCGVFHVVTFKRRNRVSCSLTLASLALVYWPVPVTGTLQGHCSRIRGVEHQPQL